MKPGMTNIEITRELIDDLNKQGMDIEKMKKSVKSAVKRATKRPVKIKIVKRSKVKRHRRYSDII